MFSGVLPEIMSTWRSGWSGVKARTGKNPNPNSLGGAFCRYLSPGPVIKRIAPTSHCQLDGACVGGRFCEARSFPNIAVIDGLLKKLGGLYFSGNNHRASRVYGLSASRHTEN